MFNIKAVKEDFTSRCDGTNQLTSFLWEARRLARVASSTDYLRAIVLTLHEGKESQFVGIHPIYDLFELTTGMAFHPELYVADYMLLKSDIDAGVTTKKLFSCIEGESSEDEISCLDENFPISYTDFQQLKKYGFQCFSSIPKTRKLVVSSTINKTAYDRIYCDTRFYRSSFLSYFQLNGFSSYRDLKLISEWVNHERRYFNVTLEIKCQVYQESEILEKIQNKGCIGEFTS